MERYDPQLIVPSEIFARFLWHRLPECTKDPHFEGAAISTAASRPVIAVDSSLPPLADRDAIFISHANPEDNAFATWLTLRLMREGYRVWCDLVKLRGGRDFWRDIESAIRLHTRRFLFVTSRTSNQKQGTLQELAVATGVARALKDDGFIIPVKVDDLPYGEHNIQINRLHAVNFTAGWFAGLGEVLKALEDAGVPRPEQEGPAAVAGWWNANRLNRSIVKPEAETLWTNWFPLRFGPRHLWMWDLTDATKLPAHLAFPAYRAGDRLFSFADAESLLGVDAPLFGAGTKVPFHPCREPPPHFGVPRHEVQTAVKHILRQAWEKAATLQGLPLFELSSRRKTVWFPSGLNPNDTVTFDGVNGKRSRRDLCGYRTITKLSGETYRRYWHFGIEAVPVLYPTPVLALKSHVVFTVDGKNVTGDAKAQHRARRSQCALWWNDTWRDRTLAAVAQMARGSSSLSLPIFPGSSLVMESRPLQFRAPKSYRDEDVKALAAEDLNELEREDDASE